MHQNFQKLYDYAIQYGVDFAAAIVILVVGRLVVKFSSDFVERGMIKAGIEKTVAAFARHVIFYGGMAFVIIAALNKLGFETSSFIALVGAISLAIGLAIQGALANFASGVLIILFRPFKVGDSIDAGGAQGIVEEIQIFNTLLTTADNKRVFVPNAKITGDKITVDVKAGSL